MRRYYIIEGDKTTAGGIVKKHTGAGIATTINGKTFSYIDDKVDCPVCKSEGTIKEADSRHSRNVRGFKPALNDDLCVCKCHPSPKLINSQTSAYEDFADDDSNSADTNGANSQNNLKNNLINDAKYNMTFLLKDGRNKPLSSMPYTCEIEGSFNIGTTDENGCTENIKTNVEKTIKIYIGNNPNNPSDHGDVLIASAKSSSVSNAQSEGKTDRLKKPWSISDNLRQGMIQAEGAHKNEYKSLEGGNNTIGIGHKIKDSEIKNGRFKQGGEYPQPLSMEQMVKLKDEDIALNGGEKINEIIHVPLYQYEYDAIIDLCFNGGGGALTAMASSLYDERGNKQSPNTNKVLLADLLNHGKYNEVPKYLRNHFNTSNRIWNRGVQNRRNMDARMFENSPDGYKNTNDAPKK